MVGYHDLKRRKPNPNFLNLVMARAGLTPSGVVHVGDQPHETQASLAAGVIPLAQAGELMM